MMETKLSGEEKNEKLNLFVKTIVVGLRIKLCKFDFNFVQVPANVSSKMIRRKYPSSGGNVAAINIFVISFSFKYLHMQKGFVP